MDAKTGIEFRESWVRWAMFLAIAVIYLAFPTRNYFFDGIDFAQTIEQTSRLHPSLTHPNHLIYNVVGWLFYRSLQAAGLEMRAVAALQILNSFLSVICAYVLFTILTKTLESRYLCYCLTLLFAFSATWWKFSTDADAYIPSVLFLLVSFYLALPNRKTGPLLVALVYSISLCLHQVAIVFFPVLVVAMFLQGASLSRPQRIVKTAIFAAAATLITLVAYAWSFHLLTGTISVPNLFRWAKSYAPDESFGFHPLNNLGFTLRGHFRLFFGGRLNASKGLVNPFIAILTTILVPLFLLLAFRTVRHFRKPDLKWLRHLQRDPMRRAVALLCLIWVAVYLVFLFFVLAHHTYYRLFYLPAVIVLAGLVLDSYNSVARIKRKYRLALFIALLSITNFLMLIYPYSHTEKYPPLALAMEMNQAWPKGTVIYYGMPNADQSLVKYFNPETVWKQLNPRALDLLSSETHATESRGASVWLETTAIDQLSDTPAGAQWLQLHSRANNARSLITRAHNIRYVQVVGSEKE